MSATGPGVDELMHLFAGVVQAMIERRLLFLDAQGRLLLRGGGVTGTLPAGNLTPGTVVNRAAWSAATTYRPGDLVVSGSATYIALLANTNVAPSGHPLTWQPVGGGTGGGTIPPPYAYVVDADGAYVVDADGAYIYVYL